MNLPHNRLHAPGPVLLLACLLEEDLPGRRTDEAHGHVDDHMRHAVEPNNGRVEERGKHQRSDLEGGRVRYSRPGGEERESPVPFGQVRYPTQADGPEEGEILPDSPEHNQEGRTVPSDQP